MLARAPLVVFQGVATSLLPHLTRLRSRGEAGDGALPAHRRRRPCARSPSFTALVAVVVAVAGPELMQLAFGDAFSYDRAGLLIVTAGDGPLPRGDDAQPGGDRPGPGPCAPRCCWAGCAIGFLVWCLLPAIDEARRIEVGFTAAAAALDRAAAAASPAARRRGCEPGSAEEIEARLAAADEAS